MKNISDIKKRKMITNKKGIEALVATVLLILITIAAVGIVWGAVMPIIRQNIESSQNCYGSGLEIKQGGYTCFDSINHQIQLQIGRGEKSINITDIQVSLSSAGTSKSFKIVKDSSNLISGRGIPNENEEIAYLINGSKLGFTTVDSASIAAILKVGNTESLCPANQPVAISAC